MCQVNIKGNPGSARRDISIILPPDSRCHAQHLLVQHRFSFGKYIIYSADYSRNRMPGYFVALFPSTDSGDSKAQVRNTNEQTDGWCVTFFSCSHDPALPDTNSSILDWGLHICFSKAPRESFTPTHLGYVFRELSQLSLHFTT